MGQMMANGYTHEEDPRDRVPFILMGMLEPFLDRELESIDVDDLSHLGQFLSDISEEDRFRTASLAGSKCGQLISKAIAAYNKLKSTGDRIAKCKEEIDKLQRMQKT